MSMADRHLPNSMRGATSAAPIVAAHHGQPPGPLPRLITLGRLSLEAGRFSRPKPLLLLTYLAIEGPKHRRFLSELFFPGTKDPRDALSTSLARLQRAIPGAVSEDGGRLRAQVACDAVEVLSLLDAGQRADAVRAYPAPFLERLDLSLPSELEDWVYLTREHLAERVRDAAIDEAASLERDDPALAAIADAAVAITAHTDPHPEVIQRLAGVLTHIGHADARRLQALAARHGLQPASEVGVGAPAMALGPVPAGPLIGRDAEVRQIEDALLRPDVRLVTIHGPGGVGKTRLAQHVVRLPAIATRFARQRGFVTLETLSEEGFLPSAIASSLGRPLPGDTSPWDALARAVAGAEVLIVLDGWDVLGVNAPALAALLRSSPAAHVLVTSRERLNLPEEHVLSLRGLALPDRTDRASARSSEAMQMLLTEARRHDLAFVLDDDDLASAARVCNALDGLPLGLQLAASWMRVATLPDIASAVERDATALDQVRGDRTGLGSLRGVVERSWLGLGARGREIARRLSVFPGGFRREAAAVVAGASIADLARLVDSSWLSMRRDGRYEQHMLLRQYASAQLSNDPEAASATHTAMAQSLAELVAAFPAGAGSASPRLLRLVTEEEANLVACFEWASTVGDGPTLVTLAEPLLWYFATMGRFREAQTVFRAAAAQLPERAAATSEARAHVLASLAWCCRFAGAVDEATEHARGALASARTSRSPLALVLALDTIGIVCVLRGENQAARDHLNEGLTLAERSGDEVRANRIREKLVYALMALDDMDEADAVAADALAQVEDGRVPPTIDAVATYVAQGYLALAQGQWAQAVEATAAGLELALSLGYQGPQPLLRAASALASVQLGASGDVQRLHMGVEAAEDALPLAREHGDGTAESFAHMALAWASRAQGRGMEALEHVRAGLRTSKATGNRLTRAWILPALVALYEDTGDTAAARALASALLGDGATPTWIAADLRGRGYAPSGPSVPELADIVDRLLDG